MKEERRTKLLAKPLRRRGLARQMGNGRFEVLEQRTKLDETRAQLQESYARYTELYELAPVGYLTLDKNGCIRELNDKAARLLSFPLSWLIDKPFLVFIASHDVRRFLSYLLRCVRSAAQETIALDLHVNDRNLPVQIASKTTTHDGAVMHRMILVDLTDTKRTEKQLKHALDSWHALVQNAPDVIMTVRRDGKILFVNRPAWGHTVRALVGTNIVDYVPEVDRTSLKKCIDSVFSSGKRTSCDVPNVDGSKDSWFTFSFGPIQASQNSKANGTTVMVREISEYKRAEEALRTSSEQMREFAGRVEAVREEERTRVAREIHDELGQALTVLKLDLSWLQNKTPKGEKDIRNKMKAMIRDVDETIERVRRIASDLRPSVLDDLGLIPAIEWQLAELKKRSGMDCKFRSNVEKVDLDSERSATVFRVVQEALTNVMRHAAASSIRIELKLDRSLLRLSVIDDGKGIAKKEMNNATSLGIVGMKERIYRVGGEFRIQSRPGKGTKIEIELPV